VPSGSRRKLRVKSPRRIDRFRNRNRVEAHDLTFLVIPCAWVLPDANLSINGRVGTVIQQMSHGQHFPRVTANDIALRIDTEDGVKVTRAMQKTSTDLKLKAVRWARAVPNCTVQARYKQRSPRSYARLFLSIPISSPLIPRETLEHLTVSRTWPFCSQATIPWNSATTEGGPVQFAEISFR